MLDSTQHELVEFRKKEFKERVNRLRNAKRQSLVRIPREKKELHIVYVMHQVEVFGGVKVIFEHANRLTDKGVKVTLVSNFPMPTWYPIKAEYISVPLNREVATGIPECDVIIATSWNHINACIETGIAPVVFFEQGGSHLFEWDNLPAERKEILKKMLSLPNFVFTVSNTGAQKLKTIYGIDNVPVFYNALDDNIFFSRSQLPGQTQNPYMMIVGSDKNDFKGIPDLITAFEIINSKGFSLNLVWITKDKPQESIGRVYIAPPQETIGDLFRGASVYVCGSYYECFALPPLEAMACGCPVVTTNNEGVMEYAKDRYNCLLADMGSPESLAEKVIELLKNPELYSSIQRNGINTAAKFCWEEVMQKLLNYYERIAEYRPC